MSKDIWHFPSEAPAYCFLCVFEDSFDDEVHCGHYNPVKKQFCSTEGRYEINQVKKYCDLLHLLDCEQELDRTRKALDVARNGLEYIFGYEGAPEYVVKHIRQVLDQIKNETVLEQKDVR